MRADVSAFPSLLVAGRAVGGEDRPATCRVTARLAKRRHALGDESFAVGGRLGQVGGERRHTLGSSLRETAFYLRIQQQPSRCLPAFHYTKQRLGPEPVPDQRKGKLHLQIGRRLAKRLGQARANDRQMCPAIGHGQTQRPWLAAVLEDRCDAGLLVRIAVAQNG